MSIDLSLSMIAQTRSTSAAKQPAGQAELAAARPAMAAIPTSLAATNQSNAAPEPIGSQKLSAERQVSQAAQAAAERMFQGREVEVDGFLDDGSGRFVYRISDKDSGQVLAQTPPDALLRFYASYEGVSQPLVSVDA